ncbi:peptidoglycan editing factor PgeF [Palleronia abyssalis]|uniref:Purine nucleoside phosphorylase n=1 Tax=Palleronia abyssalis TaxID=1501240 RepID=A0A2R8BY30_9RHOB|nr:peptidoglycan editing factor PgeF [Palleronia abyssalis]SPJ25078.1 Laccase domain protein YfiH [Palleronia abyssalis]
MSVSYLTCDVLDIVPHGFFTRRGGASSGVFAGLNCGTGSKDQGNVVRINRARATEAMDVAPEALFTVPQVHSARVVEVTDTLPEGDADAMVTTRKGIALGILTADCMPVLLADSEAGVIGALHAGWRGARDGVIENTVAAMERLGARRDRIAAAIGPCISQANYEVGPELLEEFIMDDPEAPRFFAQGKGDRLLFNLPGYGLHALRKAGVGAADWIGHCTYADEGRFYSYRRATHRREADYGRLISIIRSG